MNTFRNSDYRPKLAENENEHLIGQSYYVACDEVSKIFTYARNDVNNSPCICKFFEGFHWKKT